MTTLSWASLMQATEPHDTLGAIAIAVVAALLLVLRPSWLWGGLVLIVVMAVGIAVDLTAHGWTH